MTPEDLAAIRRKVDYYGGATWRDLDLRDLCDALEQAWAERDAMEDSWVEWPHYEAERDRAELAEAKLARVRELCDEARIWGWDRTGPKIRAAIEGDNQ